ncbi:MAG: DUF433 domain-containing protein [Anaerolineales bacterium]
MDKEQMHEHIVVNPDIMVGKPVINGTRLTVEYILGLLAQGTRHAEYSGITEEDIQACLWFTTKVLGDTDFLPLFVDRRQGCFDRPCDRLSK